YTGHICIHHKSAGVKRNYCLIDFFRRVNSIGIIYKIIKDLNRTAFIGAIIYENGLFSYIILSEGLYIGQKIFSGNKKGYKGKLKLGFASFLYYFNLFSILNNIELKPFLGATISRAA